MFRILISSALLSTTFAQLQCMEGAFTGPALFGCQNGQIALVNPATGEEECCPTASAFEPTSAAPATAALSTSIATDAAGSTFIVTQAPATTAGGITSGSGSTTSTCVDKKNPRTGVSDCPNLANLCNDANYITIMTQQCPRTCGRCGSSSTGSTRSSGTCVDMTNPRTGVSDCPSLANLCNDSNYYSIMTTQCPKTCGRCGSSTGSTTAGTGTAATTTASSGTCADRVNPATGASDCPSRRSLCTNSAYLTLMREQCPRTCGFC